MVDDDVILGRGVRIFDTNLVNIFGCEIGDESFVGPFVEITRGVKIGKNCIIESHSFLCTGVTLEDEVFIGHGVVFANDLYPRPGQKVEFFLSLVKQGASIGSNATIVGATIGRYAVIGAGSVVTCNVEDFSIYAGNPARKLKQYENYEQMQGHMRSRQRIIAEGGQ